jgi:ubiquinone/menaquinone biosynthesis C-methylase UbiE
MLQGVERIEESMPRHYFSEHLARYEFIRSRLTHARNSLDLGCGVGYGTRSICESSIDHLVGLDISVDAIRQAKAKFNHPKIHYLIAEGTSLPFADQTFDAVISFEVIEHLPEKNQPFYLSEIRRVLTNDGLAFISTPNREFTSGRANPYHLKELYFSELEELLSRYFVVELYGQRCTKPVAKVYEGKKAKIVRKLKEYYGIQFLLPNWAKRLMELFLTGSTMSSVGVRDYEFLTDQIEMCQNFIAVCKKSNVLMCSRFPPEVSSS